jgi:Leucine-rich repeat (LRR) protein
MHLSFLCMYAFLHAFVCIYACLHAFMFAISSSTGADLSHSVIKYLIRFWPMSSSAKVVVFLGTLKDAISFLPLTVYAPSESRPLAAPTYFRELLLRIRCCMYSDSKDTSASALDLWLQEEFKALVQLNKEVARSIFFDMDIVLERHWCKDMQPLFDRALTAVNSTLTAEVDDQDDIDMHLPRRINTPPSDQHLQYWPEPIEISTASHSLLDLDLLRRIAISEPSLSSLQIIGRNSSFLASTGGHLLSRALSQNTCITSLNLDGNKLGIAGLSALLPALTHLTAMSLLSLARNNIMQAIGVIAPAFIHLTCITSLNLAGNLLGSAGLSALLPALTHLTALTSLDLTHNQLTAEDGARICGAAVAAGMTRLQRLEPQGVELQDATTGLHLGLRVSDVVGCLWKNLDLSNDSLVEEGGDVVGSTKSLTPFEMLGLPKPPPDFVTVSSFGALMQYLFSSDRAGFAAQYHPLLPEELVRRIKSSDPSIANLEIKGDHEGASLRERGALLLSRALSLNTCITSLNLAGNRFGSAGLSALLPALTHLTALTSLDLTHNQLTVEDGARICGAAVAAGMTRLQRLELDRNGCSVSSVVASMSAYWGLLRPPPDFVDVATFSAIMQYVFSSDRAGFAAQYHPLLPAELMVRIGSSDPLLTSLEIASKNIGARGGCILSRALSLNTCITSLNLAGNLLGSAGLSALLPALTHLTVLTSLDLTHNQLTVEDGARICGAAVAAGMTRLQRLELNRNGFSALAVVWCDVWKQLGLSHPADDTVFISSFGVLMQYVFSSDRAGFAAQYHPLLPEELVRRIKSSDPSIANLEIKGASWSSEASKFLGERGGRLLACALLLNTCITSLNLEGNQLRSAGLAALLPALPTALTSLNLSWNNLTVEDGARICGAAVAAGMTRLQRLELEYNGFSVSSVVACESWRLLRLLRPPDEIIRSGWSTFIQHLLSEDKISCNSIRIFVVGETTMGKTSLVRALMSPSSTCCHIELDDRTIGIDCYDMCLHSTSGVAVAAANVGGGAISTLPSARVASDPTIYLRIWDLAGQDVYTLSHSVHFSHRCIYFLLWKPGESLNTTMQRLSPWLESLCVHVPDAHIVLVASHCKMNITDDQFQALSSLVENAAHAKVQSLNDITRLEVDELRTLLLEAEQHTRRLASDYAVFANSTSQLARAENNFSQLHPQVFDSWETFYVRASAGNELPRSLRTRASAICDALGRERLLCERLQLLLGIRDGGRPDGRDACKLTLHCKSVDSVDGHGVAELRGWLYGHCRSLTFMGEFISSNWTAVADVFDQFGDSVLSREQAIAMVRQHLPILRGQFMNDDALWNVIKFWSLVGRIFVYETQVVRDPSTLIALLKPLLHHEPLQMMARHQQLLDADSLVCSASRSRLEQLLRSLHSRDELPLELLDYFKSWKHLAPDQRSAILSFFERSRLLCRLNRRPDVRLITSRVRSKPHLTQEVENVTSSSAYHALYLLPLNHIGIIARLQSAVASLSLECGNVEHYSGRDSLIIRRLDDPSCACVFSVEDFAACVEHRERFRMLCGQLGEQFSCVLRTASSDFGMFKFASTLADAALYSGNFGTRFQCWVSVTHTALAASATFARWTLFCGMTPGSGNQQLQQQQLLSGLSLSCALQHNHHEEVVPGESIVRMFRPRSRMFVSHSWGDGTSEFIKRLKVHLEQLTLVSVWVDQDCLNQQQEVIIPAFREALCQARIVLIVLTPTYLTRPNCLRELRWALDFEQAGHLKVVLLSLHTAVTFDERLKLVRDGPMQGLVFSSKEKKVKRLCPEAIALVKRLNDVHMNTLPWHELQAWRSDTEGSDWEEHRSYVQGGVDKTVRLASGSEGLVENTVKVMKDWLVCVAPRPVSECERMDDTDALTASDVTSPVVACSVLDVTRYPEDSAAILKSEIEQALLRAPHAPSPVPPPQPPLAVRPVLSPLDDLRSVSAQALGDEIKMISPEYAGYSALFMGAGFDGTLLCDVVDDAELLQLVQDVGISNKVHCRRVLAQLRAVRARYQQPPGH